MNRTNTRPGSRTRKRSMPLIVSAIVSFALSACAQPDQAAGPEHLNPISVENVWSPEFAGGDTRAVYLTIINSGNTDDRVIAVQSDAATTTTIHQSNHLHGVIRMQEMPTGLAVPAQSQVQLAPGSTHVMMSGLARSFEVGDTFQLVLEFEQSGEITIDAEVKSLLPQ